MKVLIIEDEKPAAEIIFRMIHEYNQSIDIAGVKGSIKESVIWLKQNSQPDLIILDIQLSDGSSLEIFKQVEVNCPVIFTTAYDKYTLDAFRYNSIDYLLKPIKQIQLNAALEKCRKVKEHYTQNILTLIQDYKHPIEKFKSRVVVRKGIDFRSIKTADIAFFYTELKLVFLVTDNKEKFIIDKSLTDLESELDPEEFFRANRKYLVNINAIKHFKTYKKGKILIELSPTAREQVIVSRDKVTLFRSWMER